MPDASAVPEPTVKESAAGTGDGIWPRSVAVLSDQEYLSVFNDPDRVERLEDREALLIPYSLPPEATEDEVIATRELLRSSGQLASGALLIHNPYDEKSYVPASEALETLAVAKYHHLAVVASLLGAQELRVTDAKVERKNSDTRGAVKAGVKGVGVEVDASMQYASELEAHLKLETDFGGSAPEPDDAMDYIRAHNLVADHSMTALVALRRGKNPVLRYQLTMDATRESQRNITSALGLAKALPKLIELNGNFARTAEAVSSIKITTEIKFPKLGQ